MSEGEANGDTDERGGPPPQRRSVRLGRRIFVLALIGYTLALCLAAARSWLPNIFWPTPSSDARTAYRGVDCVDGLVELRDRLGAEVVRVVRLEPRKRAMPDSSGAEATETQPQGARADFWSDWDDRFAALRDACSRPGADPADAYGALYRLRHRQAAFVSRFERDAAPLARDANERLERARDVRANRFLPDQRALVATTHDDRQNP